jgi:diacylglycerol kinase (ATP)
VTGSRGRPVVVVDTESASTVSAEELREAIDRLGGSERIEWVDTSDRSDHGLDDDGMAAPSSFERGRNAAARAVASGAATVVACGDDSTVRACLEAVAGTSTSLGLVSLGPGTLLAGNLMIPPGLDAVPDALDGELLRIDVGEANGEVFAVMAGFGIDTLLGRGDEAGGAPSAWEELSVLRSLPRRLTDVTVHVDGVQRFSGRTLCLLVANCPDGPGRASIVPGADPTDGTLDVAVVAPRHLVEWPIVLWRLLTGRPQQPEHVRRFSGEWVHVQSWRPRAYELDGDVRPPTSRVDVRVWPDAVSVRLPAVTSAPPAEAGRAEPDTAGAAGSNGESAASTSSHLPAPDSSVARSSSR